MESRIRPISGSGEREYLSVSRSLASVVLGLVDTPQWLHAFEESEDPFEAIRVLKRLKQVDRILTSGGTGEWPEKIERLSRYEEEVGPEIEILAGGGIDQQSIRMICQATGIREFHIGRSAREPAAATGVVRSERVKALVETAQEGC